MNAAYIGSSSATLLLNTVALHRSLSLSLSRSLSTDPLSLSTCDAVSYHNNAS